MESMQALHIPIFGVYACIPLNSSLDDEKLRSDHQRAPLPDVYGLDPLRTPRRGPNPDAAQHATPLSIIDHVAHHLHPNAALTP